MDNSTKIGIAIFIAIIIIIAIILYFKFGRSTSPSITVVPSNTASSNTASSNTAPPAVVGPVCDGGAYCNGIQVPREQAVKGSVVCGKGPNPNNPNIVYTCTESAGKVMWTTTGEQCAATMINRCV